MMAPSKRKSKHVVLWVLICSLVFLAAPESHGQASPTATGPGSYVNVGITGSFFNVNYGQRWVEGGALYVDANLYRKAGVEVQIQSLRFNQQGGTRENTYLAGPRYSFRSRGLVPYAKVLAGTGRFIYPYGYGVGTYFVLAPGAGLDFDLKPRIKIRIIDLEYQMWPQFSFGELHPYGASAGISFRLF
jgi:hypothetical protein